MCTYQSLCAAHVRRIDDVQSDGYYKKVTD